jgi:hypothetical protein
MENKLTVKVNSRGFYIIGYEGGQIPPMSLSGVYTNKKSAEFALNMHLAKELEKAKTKEIKDTKKANSERFARNRAKMAEKKQQEGEMNGAE